VSSRENIADAYKRDFWIKENRKHIPAHYRLHKAARIITGIAGGQDRDLLDIGCGPATLGTLLPGNIRYHGIDIAIHDPAPNLIETDILKNPIAFGEMRFDIIAALGLFEYVGASEAQKLSEIAQLLSPGGKFILTFTNFDHHDKRIFEAFSNVRSSGDFRDELARHFTVDRYFPASHNWHGGQPTRPLVKAANMHVNANIPFISPKLAVEYFFICSRRG
jgi:SAM-dependent methyltransferase